MKNLNILQKDYTSDQGYYQLKLPFNIECMISADDPVRLLSRFVEGMPAPDHATVARFRSLHFLVVAQDKLAGMSSLLYDLGEISGHDIFIDGTKIEAASNKYTFVWKKAVSRYMKNLLQKAEDLIGECEERYDIRIVYGNKVQKRHMKRLRKQLIKIKKDEGIGFVHGKGKARSQLQKDLETLDGHISRIKDYTKKIHICGERNSYSKTDEDATFMLMKEDAMKNGQLKPAYNLQHGVDSEYITWLSIGPQPTDTTTLIPFLKEMEGHLSFKYQNIVADAGYESEENYLFIEGNGQTDFIKPANYEISKKKKYKNDISRVENMEYIEEGRCYVCSRGRILWHAYDKKDKTKTGYIRNTSVYTCEDCRDCPSKGKCIKGRNCKAPLEERTKNLYVSHTFQAKRKEDLERILSAEGCRLRMNRSIQAEGLFGNIKADMGVSALPVPWKKKCAGRKHTCSNGT